MPNQKSTLLFLFSAIGLIVLPHINHIPPSLFAYFYGLWAWRMLCLWQPKWLPKPYLIAVLAGAGIFLIYRQHIGLLGQDAGTNLFITALGLKLFEIKSLRDIYLIVFLAFIVASSQFLYEQNILMALYIVLVSTVLFATLIIINSLNVQTKFALKTAATLIAQALPMTVVLFVLFPRLEAPQWLIFDEDHHAHSGLSDTLEAGSITNLGLSDELVFRAKFNNRMPPPSERYWRGPVFSHTTGRQWLPVNSKTPLSKPSFIGEPYHYTLLMEPQAKNWVFALDLASDFSLPLSQHANFQLTTDENPDKRAEYELTSYPEYNTGNLTAEDEQQNLQLPDNVSDKIKQLVEQLDGYTGKPEKFISQLLQYFKDQDFYYTLTPPVMQKNPIEEFLFESRHGFCSHYASTFVYLMRVAHIPARVVTGYQGGEFNPVGNFLEIRQANAHAWAEVWLAGKGWVRFDPTAAIAPERIEQGINVDLQISNGRLSFGSNTIKANAGLNWLKHTRQFWQSVDYNWQRWVINYDNNNQYQLLASLGINNIKSLIYWLIGSIAALTGLLSLFLLYQAKSKDKVGLIYQRFCQKLTRHGLIRQPTEGAQDFAQRICLQLPAHTETIKQITALYLKLRYGKQPKKTDFEQFRKSVALFKV
ncbi:MAG: DUF3488 and transglutaminase-like domain-containing protein [Methylococcaceae bacterium]|jgi:transglutaminase-like putative cysteine protease